MGKKNSEKWDGEERRKGNEPYYLGDRREDRSERVHADYVPTNNDERYQFEGLVITYRARFNVWHVEDMKKPTFQRLLYEVKGYVNGQDALLWAKEYIKNIKYSKDKKEGE
jgi:hypothetical protein